MIHIIKLLLGAIAGFLCIILILLKWLVLFSFTGKTVSIYQEINSLVENIDIKL